MARESLDDLLRQEMRDLLDGETQITKALPRMARAAESGPLRAAIEQHLRETERQIERLNQAFELLDERPRRKTCQGIKGLIDEAKELMGELQEGPVLDAALIAAAQKVEHYEIAAYGTVRTYASQLGHGNLVSLFETTLREEKATDQKLTGLAEGMVNPEAAEGQEVDEGEGLPVRMARSVGTAAGRAAALARQAAQSLGVPGRARSSRGRSGSRKSARGARSKTKRSTRKK